MKKICKTLVAIVLIASLFAVSFVFASCNKDEPFDYFDVYRNATSHDEYTSKELLMTLPTGVNVLTSSSVSDYGYVKSLDAFVVTDGTNFNLAPCSNNANAANLIKSVSGTGFELAIRSIRVSNGLIAVKRTDLSGTAEVYNSNGKVVISKDNFEGMSEISDAAKVVNILTPELVAVASKYDKNVPLAASVKAKYTSIYRVSTGKLAGYVLNESGDVTALSGYDDYVVVKTQQSDDTLVERIVKVPMGENANEIVVTPNGYYYDTVKGSDYYPEIVYLSDGRFYVYEDWVLSSVNEDTEYTFWIGDSKDAADTKYYIASRHIYDADDDSLNTIDSDIICMNVLENYTDKASNGSASTSSFLKEGYHYSSYGLYINTDKEGVYDQFILDDQLNVVLSLSGNFGVSKSADSISDVSFFDLIMSYVDGYGVCPLLPSIMRMYDRYGNVVFENDDYTIVKAAYNAGVVIARAYKADEKAYYYGAFNTKGEVIIDFKYAKLSSFTGDYAIGMRYDNETKAYVYELIGRDGVKVAKMSDGSVPLSDMTTTSAYDEDLSKTVSMGIFKAGVYMYQVANTDATTKTSYPYYYGIKNFNVDTTSNVIEAATATGGMVAGTVLYSPINSSGDIFVFAKYADSANTYLYRIV